MLAGSLALQGLLGLGEFSSSKSYYPELQSTIDELNSYKNFLANIIDSMPSVIIGVDSRSIEVPSSGARGPENGHASDWGEPIV